MAEGIEVLVKAIAEAHSHPSGEDYLRLHLIAPPPYGHGFDRETVERSNAGLWHRDLHRKG